ncbi:MAG: SPOR domain-containing protein [Gammaproteobacteria bacterium]
MITATTIRLLISRGILIFTSLWLTTANLALADSYEEGRSAYVSGDYKRAYTILKPLAESGDPEAQKILGIMFDYGHGVKKDPHKALQWYIRSAEQGQPAVQYQVGAKYFRGDGIKQDYAEAAKWWELAANGDQADAQFNLGLMYYRGLSIKQDNLKAARLFQLAAKQGHGYAQYSLAVMYSFGDGVEKNYATALEWFRKSAEQGIAQAQFNMGVYYENGYAVKKELTTAKKWYERAAAQGLKEAKAKIEELKTVDMTKPAATMAEYSIDEILPGTIRREEWVLGQRPESYTLQISSVTKEKDLVNFLKKNHLESDAAYIELVINGVTRYNAFYGVYDNYTEARQALEELPDVLRKAKPWVRNFSVLQAMLN